MLQYELVAFKHCIEGNFSAGISLAELVETTELTIKLSAYNER